MWPFVSKTHQSRTFHLAARPHPSRILRSHSRRTNVVIEHDRMVILVRGDLSLTPGRLANHAASVAVRLFHRVCRSSGVCSRWNRSGQPKLVLRVNDADALDRITKRAVEKKIAVAASHVRHDESNKVRTLVGLFGPAKTVDPLIHGLKPY